MSEGHPRRRAWLGAVGASVGVLLAATFAACFSDDYEGGQGTRPGGVFDAAPPRPDADESEGGADPACPPGPPKEGETCPSVTTEVAVTCSYVERRCIRGTSEYEVIHHFSCMRGSVWTATGTTDPCTEPEPPAP